MGTNILQDVQDYIVGKLSADYQLSGMCAFLSENRKDIDYEIKNALGRQGIVAVCMTPKATYAGKYEDAFIAWTLEQIEIDIVENTIVNRGKKNGYMTGQDIAMRLFDVLCPLSGEFEGQFCPVTVEEGEDNGLLVNKCILKALVWGEHSDVPQPPKPLTYQFVKLLDEPPPLSVQPLDGWMWNDNGTVYFYSQHVAYKLGGVSWNDMSSYVSSQVSSKAELSDVFGLSAAISSCYTKSQTSSAYELDIAFANKANISSLQSYLPLSGGVISGILGVTGYSQFHGAVDTPQVNITISSDEDAYNSIRSSSISSLEIRGNYGSTAAFLPIKAGTIAYVGDIEQQVSSKAETSALDEVSSYVQDKVSELSSSPYSCGWRIDLKGTQQDSSLSAVLYGTLTACTKNRTMLKFSCVLDSTNIPSYASYAGMSYDVFSRGQLSDVYDGHEMANPYIDMYFSDAWGYHNNVVPSITQTTFLSIALSISR